jgi:hypothetical protein
MSASQPSYRLDHMPAAMEQIQSVAAIARQAGKLARFTEVLRKAVELLRSDPHRWGDPLYRLKSVDGIVCQGVVSPVVFRFVIYEQVQAVVLLNVRLIADFV